MILQVLCGDFLNGTVHIVDSFEEETILVPKRAEPRLFSPPE